MLTGKTKEDFYNWLEKQDLAPYKVMFESIPEFVQMCYIQEFMDMMGYCIVILPSQRVKNRFAIRLESYKLLESVKQTHFKFGTRTEALKYSIGQFDEFYNEKT